MELPKLPPSPTDKLVVHCKVFGHEWTNEWVLLKTNDPYTHTLNGWGFVKYKLCLRCSEYHYKDPYEEAIKQSRKRMEKIWGVTPIDIEFTNKSNKQK